jgi:transposase
VLADKAYDADRIRELIQGARHFAQEQVALEAPLQQAPLPRAHPDRALLLEGEARPPLRFPLRKLAANFLATIQLASMRLWLRAYESTA